MKLTKVTVESAIADLCNNLSATYPGNQMLNYGEAVESIIENQAGNYVTKDGATYCAVNDTYKLVLFLVRESASVEQQPAGGRANSLESRFGITFELSDKELEQSLQTINRLAIEYLKR